ncbi:SAM-dependent methyltransferase [Streptomyces sp. NPDC059740]|uniref:SAM-dependent methyltransferase n=1 Tax=Streptomyces sp. NPDC059740 TaxID=3346926 RepID=UPI0036491C92
MAGEEGFRPDEIDTSRPHPARMYDYYLGGRDNYEVDREAAQQALDASPQIRAAVRINRAFLRRAVRTVVAAGVRQVIDLGTGIPTSPNTHEVAREVAPDTRVVYVDNDPIVATHAGARLTNTPGTGFVLADIREPKSVLESPVVRELIDFDQPVAVSMLAVLHFVTDAEDPAGIVRTFADAVPAGSHLLLTHVTSDQDEQRAADRPADEEVRRAVVGAYREATAGLVLRSHAEIARLFGPFALIEPGLVPGPQWRPDGTPPGEPADAPRPGGYGGVGRKP